MGFTERLRDEQICMPDMANWIETACIPIFGIFVKFSINILWYTVSVNNVNYVLDFWILKKICY